MREKQVIVRDEPPKFEGANPWILLLFIGFIFLLAALCHGCATTLPDKSFPMEGCVVHREPNSYGYGTTYERVIILKWRDSEQIELEVKYPDSFTDSTYFIQKEKVQFSPCPSHLPL